MNREIDYKDVIQQMLALTEDVDEEISDLANASALLNQHLADINWCGFYLMKDGLLKLGPFQGKVACTVIRPGRGVCGAAVEQNQTMLVPDVHEFPGHIACDSASNSEIVVPIHRQDGSIYGVLDIDSPYKERFTEEDQAGLEEIVRELEKILWKLSH